ncbi:MAG: PEP-CTERM sorting domain-containing protein [Pirellulales bacterium]
MTTLRHKLLTLAVVCLAVASARVTLASTIYDSISNPEPYNLPSLGYQATSTDEFGDHIELGGTDRVLTTVRAGMSNWALKSTYLDGNDDPLPGYGHVTMDASGYEHDLTLNLYNVDTSGVIPVLGSLIGTQTVTAFVPWRPENQGPGDPWLAPDNNEYNGIFFTVDFDFSGDGITLPEEFVAAVAYNTNTYGASPIGLNGPYESLNVALSSSPAEPTIGVNVDIDTVFWDTSVAGFYTDGGTAGVDILRADTGWTPYTPALEISAVPEPATYLMFAAGLLGTCVAYRRRHRTA